MNCLVLDTALSACSVAVTRDGMLVAGQYEAMQKGHAESLLPMIDRVLEQAGMTYGDLDRLGVTVGPGAFTGLRIGLSTARGLAVALDLPLAGVSSLQAVALGVAPKVSEGEIAVALDARREQVYFQIFDQVGKPVSEAEALGLDEASALLEDRQGSVTLVGSGASLLSEGINSELADQFFFPDARQFAIVLSAPDYPCQRGQAPGPLYLRAPDAKLPTRQTIFARLD